MNLAYSRVKTLSTTPRESVTLAKMTDPMQEFNQAGLLLPVDRTAPAVKVVTVGKEGEPVREIYLELRFEDDDFHYRNETDPVIVQTIDQVLQQMSDDANGLLLLAYKPLGPEHNNIQPAKVYIGVNILLKLDSMILHRIRGKDRRGCYVKFGLAIGLLALHELMTSGKAAQVIDTTAGAAVDARSGSGGGHGRKWIQQAIRHPGRLHRAAARLHGLNKHGNISRVGYARLKRYVERTPDSSDNRALALAHTLSRLRRRHHSNAFLPANKQMAQQAFGAMPAVLDILSPEAQLQVFIQDLGELARLPYYKQSRRIISILQPVLTQPQLAVALVRAGFGEHIARWILNLLMPKIELHVDNIDNIAGWLPGHGVSVTTAGGRPIGVLIRLSGEQIVHDLVRTVVADSEGRNSFRILGVSMELLRRTDFVHFKSVLNFSFPFQTQILEPLNRGEKIPERMTFLYSDDRLLLSE